MLHNLGKLRTSWLQSTLTQTKPSCPQNQKQCPQPLFHPYLSFWSTRLLSRLISGFRIPSWSPHSWTRHGPHHAIASHARTRNYSKPLQPVVQGLWQQGPVPKAALAPDPARAPAYMSMHRSQKKRASKGRKKLRVSPYTPLKSPSPKIRAVEGSGFASQSHPFSRLDW